MLVKTPSGSHHVDMVVCRGEPGDMRWENIYVNPCESLFRQCLFMLLMIICLIISLIAMIVASFYLSQNVSLNCGLVETD